MRSLACIVILLLSCHLAQAAETPASHPLSYSEAMSSVDSPPLSRSAPSIDAEPSAQSDSSEEGALDMEEYLFGHINDSYQWHITTVKDRHIALHLPVILFSGESGFHCFSSARLEHGSHEGFSIAPEGSRYAGKVVEVLPDGTLSRPLDLSLTKNVLSLLIGSAILLLLVLSTARWYRRHDACEEAPRGLPGCMELLVMMVEDDIIKGCVGPDYKRFSPYLLTAFFFIFTNNLLGIVPIFPGGANVTGNIAVTLVLAMFTFFAVNLFGDKHYWKEILWPDVPLWLKVPFPLMMLIETIGLLTKPFSLMVRLFANILAGHFMILGVVAVVFLTAQLGTALNAGLSLVAVVLGVFLDFLEILVAFIQAYVFTMLSAVFIGLAHHKAETDNIN